MTILKRCGRIAPLIALLLLLSGCLGGGGDSSPAPAADPDTGVPSTDRSGGLEAESEPSPPSEPPPPPEPEPYTTEARLVAVGDIMMHSPQIPAAYDAATGTYSFDAYFTHVIPYLEGDWVVANLETPLAGEELGGYSGYPMFNAPAELADALRNAGFNIVTTANNHTMDRREQGVLNTLANVKARGLIPVGTYDSPEAAEQIAVVEKNEIAMAFLAYTYGTNGIPIPEDKPYLVNLIDEAKIKADIARARELADVVTVSLHFGNEYHRRPSEEQKRLSAELIAAGADIILGSHPHVVQPYEVIAATAEDGTPRQGIVIYSLGNFISNQGPEQGTAEYTDVGVIFSVQVKKHFPAGTIELAVDSAVPTWVHKYYDNGKRQYRILPIEETLAARNDPILTDRQYTMLDGYLQEMTRHLHSMAQAVSGDGDNDTGTGESSGVGTGANGDR
jgi:poly-gamma-glutamate synthesis protein (capsule biosynthesis protein)